MRRSTLALSALRIKKHDLLGMIGPGLITGASDEDPSGIATYSQVGSQFGLGMLWTMVFSYPLMSGIQEISARVGRVSATCSPTMTNADSKSELLELSRIYDKRGLKPDLARQVAVQLSEHDVMEAHMRDELGLNESTRSYPFQAATVSAARFGLAAILPIGALLLSSVNLRIPLIALFACVGLGLLSALGGHLAKAPMGRAALRVVVGGGWPWRGTPSWGACSGVWESSEWLPRRGGRQ